MVAEAALQSLSLGVILPQDLLADDTTLLYNANGVPVVEKDYKDPNYDDESEQDQRDYDRYVNLALAYYNGIHNTDYKALPWPYPIKGGRSLLQCRCLATATSMCTSIHCVFTAVLEREPAIKRESAINNFCSKLFQEKLDGEMVVTSCVIANGGINRVGCEFCDRPHTDEDDKMPKPKTISWEDVIPPPSWFSRYLADGVTLSDKAKLRLRFTSIALEHYNHKHHADYKLVDVLPYCRSALIFNSSVVHCNFIAKQGAGPDASSKLFFAELEEQRTGSGRFEWVVLACRVVRGKTRAGCHYCPPHGGKRVIHPTRGFRYGLYSGYDRARLRSRR